MVVIILNPSDIMAYGARGAGVGDTSGVTSIPQTELNRRWGGWNNVEYEANWFQPLVGP